MEGQAIIFIPDPLIRLNSVSSVTVGYYTNDLFKKVETIETIKIL